MIIYPGALRTQLQHMREHFNNINNYLLLLYQ